MGFRTNKTPVLQTKSASGAVASFNTALAMPLVNGEFTIQAYQEGSGDPAPDNVRNIVPRREVNIYQRGINIWDEETELGYIDISTGNNVSSNNQLRCKNYIPISPNVNYHTFCDTTAWFLFYDDNLNIVTTDLPSASSAVNARMLSNMTWKSPRTAHYMKFYFVTAYGTTYNHDLSINYPSTDTDYHAYTGNKYTIQLGQEVYGAEVDVVNGVAHCTHSIVDMGDLSWDYRADTFCFYSSVDGMKDYVDSTDYADTMNEMFKFGGVRGLSGALTNLNYYVRSSTNSHMILVRYDDYTTWTDFKNAVTGKKLVFELAEPFDIQLTPTQIETIIGNNTIFADTGDVDLTYKDLDIAKRGNFREVFKLPS